MKNSLNQLTLGMWLATGVGMGIMSHSWNPVWVMGLLALLFGVGFWANAARQNAPGKIRSVKLAVSAMYSVVLLGGMLVSVFAFGERAYLTHADSYPAFLASRHLGPVDVNGLSALADTACNPHAGGVEIYQKANDIAVIRCGMLWYPGKTFTASIAEHKS